MKRHCGPITLNIDNQAEAVTFEVHRCGREADRLGAATMANVASWALATAEKTGYQVDTSAIIHLLEWHHDST